MCSECRTEPCRLGCPNAPELEIIAECLCCKGKIDESDEQWIDGRESIYCSFSCAVDNNNIERIN